MLSHFSHVWLLEILGTIALQALLFSPGKNTGVGCHSLLQITYTLDASNSVFLCVYLCLRVCLCCLLSRPTVTKLLLLLSSVHFQACWDSTEMTIPWSDKYSISISLHLSAFYLLNGVSLFTSDIHKTKHINKKNQRGCSREEEGSNRYILWLEFSKTNG